MAVAKEAVSSAYKYKQMYWSLLENVCALLPKLNRIDPSRQVKDYVISSFAWIKFLPYNL